MASNYWESHSSLSLVSKAHLANTHREDRARGLTEQQIQQVKVHCIHQIWELSRMCKLRARVAATASVYFHRFYVRHSFGGASHDPRLVYVGCLYVASKTEETLLAAKHMVVYAKRLQPSWPYELKHLLDSEMVIVQALDFMLMVHHPYTSLELYARDAGMPPAVVQYAWAAANDLFRTHLPITQPPHVLALACMAYAWGVQAVLGSADVAVTGNREGHNDSETGLPRECLSWLLRLNVDLDVVQRVVLELGEALACPVPVISAEECKRLLEVANLPVPVSSYA